MLTTFEVALEHANQAFFLAVLLVYAVAGSPITAPVTVFVLAMS